MNGCTDATTDNDTCFCAGHKSGQNLRGHGRKIGCPRLGHAHDWLVGQILELCSFRFVSSFKSHCHHYSHPPFQRTPIYLPIPVHSFDNFFAASEELRALCPHTSGFLRFNWSGMCIVALYFMCVVVRLRNESPLY